MPGIPAAGFTHGARPARREQPEKSLLGVLAAKGAEKLAAAKEPPDVLTDAAFTWFRRTKTAATTLHPTDPTPATSAGTGPEIR